MEKLSRFFRPNRGRINTSSEVKPSHGKDRESLLKECRVILLLSDPRPISPTEFNKFVHNILQLRGGKSREYRFSHAPSHMDNSDNPLVDNQNKTSAVFQVNFDEKNQLKSSSVIFISEKGEEKIFFIDRDCISRSYVKDSEAKVDRKIGTPELKGILTRLLNLL